MNWGQISHFDIRTEAENRIFFIQNAILTFKSGRISNFDIQNPISTCEIGRNIIFCHSKTYFDIRTGAEYRILTFKIIF